MRDTAGAAAPTEITAARILGSVGRGFFRSPWPLWVG